MKLQDLWPCLSDAAAERLSELLGRLPVEDLPELIPMARAEVIWLRARIREAEREDAA